MTALQQTSADHYSGGQSFNKKRIDYSSCVTIFLVMESENSVVDMRGEGTSENVSVMKARSHGQQQPLKTNKSLAYKIHQCSSMSATYAPE